MEFFGRTTNVDFMRIRSITAIFSLFMVVASFAALLTYGINWGLDFTGGIVVELGYEQDAPLPKIREDLRKADYPDAVVQSFGSPKDVIIRLAPREGVDEKVVANNIIKDKPTMFSNT